MQLIYNRGELGAISTDMSDNYQHIYDSEIFVQSQCIWKENSLMDFFRQNLLALGYVTNDCARKVWTRGDQTVVICLTDSFTSCAVDQSQPLPRMFDPNTVIITENFVLSPTRYRVCRLPESFFGIYSYKPVDSEWQPQARINFNVNRIDEIRTAILADFYYHNGNNNQMFSEDLVNFNCHSWEGNNGTVQGLKDNFNRCALRAFTPDRKEYIDACQQLVDYMPLKNYQETVDQAHVRAWVNMVIETYSGRGTIALSEKTFRALVSPVPFVLYAGHHAMDWLENMGFDVMPDIIRHDYNDTLPDHHYEKISQYVYTAVSTAQQLKAQDWLTLKDRARRAAIKNRTRLENLAQQWPQEFAQWWADTVKIIA